MSARVRDVMTTRVVAVRTNASFREIVTTLRTQRVSALPVLNDGGKVIGVVSEADLIAREALEDGCGGHPGPLSVPGLLRGRELARAKTVTAAGLMSWPAVTISPYDLVSHAAHLMYDQRVKRLPVVDGNGRLVGIISRTDVLSVFSRPDEDIRREISGKVIPGEFLADSASFTVTVKDGIVTLEGSPGTATIGHGIINAVRHIEGVVAVRDRLTYPVTELTPVSGPLL
jgi:CBS-domain-containing membrane protein